MHASIAFLSVCFCVAQTAWCEGLVLVENGQSPYRIVIGVDATMQENYAAELLQQHVEQMTGRALPIVPDDGRPIDTEIVIGFNRRLGHLGLNLTHDSFGREAFLIKSFQRRLAGWQQSVGTAYVWLYRIMLPASWNT